MSQRRILQGLSAERVQRLETLVELKKLYRNIIRAEALLALPSPVYTAPEGEAGAARTQHSTAHSRAAPWITMAMTPIKIGPHRRGSQ